jgi:hypothetical protein
MEAIEQLGALLSANLAELLRLVAVADVAEDWKIDGATGMAPWLVAMLRLSSGTAQEWVRAAGKLADLPAVAGALGEGVLSWEQVRPATTFVNPETDEQLAVELQGLSVAQIEALARQHRPRKTPEDEAAARQRRFDWRPDHIAGGFRYGGFLPTELGEQLNQTITRMAETVGPNAETGLWDPFPQRAADALVDLARVRAGIDPDPDSCLAVIHVDGDVVAGDRDGNGTIGGVSVGAECVRRILCDCKIEFHIDGPDGTTVGIGRADRNVPRWLRRVVANRDGTCRFPGCARQIRHRHHIQHWTRQGPTNASNLVGLCWAHHHLVHEGAWTIEGAPDAELTFVSPHGRRCTSRPKPVQPHIRTRARRAAGLPDAAPTPTDVDPPDG